MYMHEPRLEVFILSRLLHNRNFPLLSHLLSSITTQLLSFLQASDAPSNVLSKALLLQYFPVSLTNLITSVSEILRSYDFRQTFVNVFNRLIANMSNLKLSIVFVPLSDSSVKSPLA